MERSIRRVLVIVNLAKEDAKEVLEEIRRFFGSRGVETVVHAFESELPESVFAAVDMAITLGGDGTLLFSSSSLAAHGIPILAVNLGQVGFITETSRDEWVDAYEKFACCSLGVSERIMVDASVTRNGREVFRAQGLNDAVIGSQGISRLIELNLFLARSHAGRYRADGLIVATPTGATGYSMGAGGPILHPEMEAFVLNPICPFTLSNRPLVVSAGEDIEIEVEESRRAQIMLTVDGHRSFRLAPQDRVRYSRSASKCLIIRSDKRNFYEVLRAKLNWAGEPNA